jgi:hypothetical protein
MLTPNAFSARAKMDNINLFKVERYLQRMH